MLEAHTNLGECLQLLYGDSAFRYYIIEVSKAIAQSQQLRFKIEALQSNLKRLSTQTDAQIKEMRTTATVREDARVFYDHYRGKVAKLEKGNAQPSDSKKQEKYQRNLKKLEDARTRYEKENRKLNELLESSQIKIEFILNEVTFKFT